jgi:alpha-ketoglutarate-dependent taurine dioxygenase
MLFISAVGVMCGPPGVRGHGVIRKDALFKVLSASYFLFAVSALLILIGSRVRSEVSKPVLLEFGSVLASLAILKFFYEYFEREDLMNRFAARVGEVENVKSSGIVDFREGDYHGDIKRMFARARKQILICKTWIPDGDIELITSGLELALVSNPKLEVKILCLDPASPLADQRFMDSGLQEEWQAGQGGKKIAENLLAIINFCKVNNLYPQVQIKVYRNLPALSLYATEDAAWLGWYWMGKEALGGPALVVKGEKLGLSKEARSNFERMWESASDYAPEIDGEVITDAREEGHIEGPPDGLRPELLARKSPAELRILLEKWPELEKYGRRIMKRLKEHGYCVVKGFPFEGYTPEAQKNIFLMFVCACGEPSDHMPPHGEYICAVKYRDRPKGKIETYSEHDREAPLHTDSHYRAKPEKYVAFLMQRRAKSGGRNILLRLNSITSEMKRSKEGREYLEYLKRNAFPSARPTRYEEALHGEHPEGFPIINESETAIGFREDTIRIALADQSPDQTKKDALNYFIRRVYQNPERRGVTLENGEILLVDNSTVLHARTAFKEDRSRVLLRVRFN